MLAWQVKQAADQTMYLPNNLRKNADLTSDQFSLNYLAAWQTQSIQNTVQNSCWPPRGSVASGTQTSRNTSRNYSFCFWKAARLEMGKVSACIWAQAAWSSWFLEGFSANANLGPLWWSGNDNHDIKKNFSSDCESVRHAHEFIHFITDFDLPW